MTTTTPHSAHPTLDTLTIAARVFAGVITDDGATVSATEPNRPAPSSGYAVSLAGCEWVIPTEHFDLGTVEDYVLDHSRILREPGIYVGAWVDGTNVYLDASMIIADRTDAEIIGAQHDQLAIFDLARGETIMLGARTA